MCTAKVTIVSARIAIVVGQEVEFVVAFTYAGENHARTVAYVNEMMKEVNRGNTRCQSPYIHKH